MPGRWWSEEVFVPACAFLPPFSLTLEGPAILLFPFITHGPGFGPDAWVLHYLPPSPVTCFLLTLQLLQTIPVGVGQVYGCDNPWTGGMILVALFISSPLICLHAAIGSIVGLLAGKTEPRSVGRPLELLPLPTFLSTQQPSQTCLYLSLNTVRGRVSIFLFLEPPPERAD